MSLRYVVAAALLEGQVLPPQFSDAKIADPALTALARAASSSSTIPRSTSSTPRASPPGSRPRTTGKWVRVDVLDPPARPPTRSDAKGVIEKFRGINPQLPVDAIAETVLNIERHTVKQLLALLASKRARQLHTA